MPAKEIVYYSEPLGGNGSGQSIFQNEVLPLTEAAGVLYTMLGLVVYVYSSCFWNYNCDACCSVSNFKL